MYLKEITLGALIAAMTAWAAPSPVSTLTPVGGGLTLEVFSSTGCGGLPVATYADTQSGCFTLPAGIKSYNLIGDATTWCGSTLGEVDAWFIYHATNCAGMNEIGNQCKPNGSVNCETIQGVGTTCLRANFQITTVTK